jgi:hypothetical protein
MKRKTIKKILLYTFSVFTLLLLVLAVHIYLVYRPKAPDAYTKIMARIDIKQQITQTDANKISAWMFHQKGIDHVLVNPQTNIVVFTFFPIKTSGNQIVNNFKEQFHYKAERFMPTTADLKNSCPAAASSITYKIYKIITQIIL